MVVVVVVVVVRATAPRGPYGYGSHVGLMAMGATSSSASRLRGGSGR